MVKCPNPECSEVASVRHFHGSSVCSDAAASLGGIYRLSKRVTPPKAGPGRPHRCGFIYFFRCDPGYIKIGYSTDPATRLKKLVGRDTAVPFDAALSTLQPLGIMAGTYNDEWRIHQQFASHRVSVRRNGEWFYEKPILDAIMALPLQDVPGYIAKHSRLYGAYPGEMETITLIESLRSENKNYPYIVDFLNENGSRTRQGRLWNICLLQNLLYRVRRLRKNPMRG